MNYWRLCGNPTHVDASYTIFLNFSTFLIAIKVILCLLAHKLSSLLLVVLGICFMVRAKYSMGIVFLDWTI